MINLIIKNKRLKILLLYIIFSIMIFISIMLINSATVGEDDILYIITHNPLDNHITYLDYMSDKIWDVHDIAYSDYIWDVDNISNYSNNITYMSSNIGWELCYPNSEGDPIDLNDPVNVVYTSNIPGLNQVITKQDLYTSFKNTIVVNSMANWNKLDKAKYTKVDVVNVVSFEHLYNSLYGIKLTNFHLDLKWWNLCYLYGISHHEDIPFNIYDIKSYTPESFYSHLKTLSDENRLNYFWKRELEKYSDKQDVFYTYMRIVHFVMNKRIQ